MNRSAEIERQPLPDDWRWVKLGDVVEQDKISLKPNDELCSRLPYLSLEHVESGTGRINPLGKSKIASNTFMFDDRHVLYGKLRPYLNKVATPNFRGRCTTEIIPLLPVGTTQKYLAHFLRLPETVDYAMKGKTGSRMPRTDMRAFMHLPVPLPSLSEQKRIVRMLDEKLATIEGAKRATQAQSDAVDALPDAYLREVIPPDGAELPQGWQYVKLGEVCNIVTGSTPSRRVSRYWQPESVPWFTVADIREHGRLVSRTEQRVSRAAIKETSLRLIPPKTVLICCTSNSIGEYAITEIPITTNQQFNGLIVKNSCTDLLIPEFLFRIISQIKRKLIHLSNTTTFYFVSVRVLKSIEIPLPSLKEQKRIVRILDEKLATVEKEKQVVEAQMEAVNALSTVYLRTAFSGGF